MSGFSVRSKFPLAWQFLTDEQKTMLRELRERGMAWYGGDPKAQPRYWLIVEKGFRPVGISPHPYIEPTITDVTANLASWVKSSLGEFGL